MTTMEQARLYVEGYGPLSDTTLAVWLDNRHAWFKAYQSLNKGKS